MKQIETIKFQQTDKKFKCEKCNYESSRKSQFERHLATDKHKYGTFETELKQNGSKKFQCLCGLNFNSRTSLWRHNKNCNRNNISSNMVTTELVMELINDNKEMKKIILEQNNTINNLVQNSAAFINLNNVNSMNNNKTFNLQFFLTETCKNAMNISDFVSNIKMELNDLETTGRKGYVEGISNIIVKNLNNLEQHMRPLHCSDLKREILYIKENNKWTKESEVKPILTKAIKTIANQNIKQIIKWKDNNPDCIKSDSKKNDLYLNIVSNSMNGITKEEGEKNINKIISNVAKNVFIEK